VVIANCDECTDHLISFHFHAKSRLKRAFTVISIAKSVIYMFVVSIPEVTFVHKTGFLLKEKFFTI